MSKTLIVIPHYGSDQLIHDLFRSAGNGLPPDFPSRQLTLIEQASYSFLIVNNNVANVGFTAACNIGLEQLRTSGSSFEFAWLLNNDTEFESHEQFERSLGVMQTLAINRDWAIVAQQVRRHGYPDRIIFGGAWECFPGGRHKSGLLSRGDWASPSEENWLSFCSVLVRADLVERIGLMDETFVNYFSDSDYSLEARQAGSRIGYSGPDSFVFHKVGQSANPGEAQQGVMLKDYMAFWKKWIGGSRHAEYLRLMGASSAQPEAGKEPKRFCAGELARAASAYPELRSWLMSLPADLALDFRDILYHYQHQQPVTPFTILCNVARELLGAD